MLYTNHQQILQTELASKKVQMVFMAKNNFPSSLPKLYCHMMEVLIQHPYSYPQDQKYSPRPRNPLKASFKILQ